VEDILQREFGRSLADEGVHILDPFVGTGNFIVRLMRQIPRTRLPYKYANELHCNEVMLLPYYIASMNIEHAYYELTGTYQPFEDICLVDTFEMAEGQQMSLLTQENTERVAQQRSTPIFVIIGNPPYNAGQVNENDNNKNRKYPVMDRRVAETYGKSSKASDKSDLVDPYVRAFRWASDRIGEEGVVAFVTNNGFLDGIAFDGMRKHLAQDFSKIYHINLKGNARTSGERRRQEAGNVFDDAIRVGVGITFLVRKKGATTPAEIYIHSVDNYLKSGEKKRFLEKATYCGSLPMVQVKPDKNYLWLTQGMSGEFETFLSMGTREAKGSRETDVEAIFKTFSLGANTNRDEWAYNYSCDALAENMGRLIDTYNVEVDRWHNRTDRTARFDDFVLSDETRIKWSSRLKECLLRHQKAVFSTDRIRRSLYRPFSLQFLYFDEILTHRQGQFPHIFPASDTETENRVICLRTLGNSKPFHCLVTNIIPDLHLTGDSQCFPLYTYDEDGSHRQENVTDWALAQFRGQYKDVGIGKEDIFHYVYALLHHPQYRERYAANLRRELPRIPFAPDFWAFAEAGKRLAELHVHYEDQAEYPLKWLETKDAPLDWRVDKMKLSKDKTQLAYNDFLTLAGIPPEAFEYRLGNRSALEWIVDQYRVTTDQRSGLVNDPNRPDDPQYILRLIGKVITVSLETVKIVKGLPKLE
jgi:predicted helicase